MGVKMEENLELEEGEAYCYKGDEDHIDPDTDFSYIDEKVQNVLGHLRKYFEGQVPAENLGPMYGGYGSFLPSYDRRPKTSERDSTTARSLHSLLMEGASPDLKPTLSVPPFAKHGTASCGDQLLQIAGGLSRGIYVNHDLHLSSAGAAKKFKMKDENLNKCGNLTNQRTLRVRIKVSSDKMARKNEAIYSGLGLANSPSSSLVNSVEESVGPDPVSQGTADESPTSILQVMTSFPVPEGLLISPLHDSLLCLIRKERLSRDWESGPSLNGSQENSPLLADESSLNIGNRKLLKEKKEKLVKKNERLLEPKHSTHMKYQIDTASLLKKELKLETPGSNDINSNSIRHTPPPNFVYPIGSVKGSDRASEVSGQADKDGVEKRVFSSYLVMEDSFESSGQESGKNQKQKGKTTSVERVWEQGGMSSCNVVSGDLGDNGRHGGDKASSPLKSHSGGSKGNGCSVAPSKQKVRKRPPICVLDEIDECNGRTKQFFEGKKSKGNQSRVEVAALLTKERLRDYAAIVPKATSSSYDASKWKIKMCKSKSQKDSNKAREIHKDFLDRNLEQTNHPSKGMSSDQPKDSGPNKLEVEHKHNAFLDKSKENFSGKEVDSQAVSGVSIKGAAFVDPCTSEGRHGTEMVPAAVNPVVIKENWVCCDNCQKWRLLPFGTKPEQLPDNWLCSMLNWLPAMNRCDISEEETTKALYALYQIPFTEFENSMQNDSNGTSVITSAPGQQFDQKYGNLPSAAVSIRGKKKYGLKKIRKGSLGDGIQVSKCTKNHLQDSVESRSLKDMKKPPTKSNIMKKSSSLQLKKLCNLDAEKHITKPEEKQMNGGDVKRLKIKNKRGVDQHEYLTSRKAKIEDRYAAGKHSNSDMDHGVVGLRPSTGLETKVGGKSMVRCEFSCSEDAKGDIEGRLLLSRNKLGDQDQVLSDGGSSDMRTQDKRNNSVKRKWQDDLKGRDNKKYVEGSRQREKKFRVQNTQERGSSLKKVVDIKSKSRVTPFLPSKGPPENVVEEVKSVDKGWQLQKDRRRDACEQISDGVDLVRTVFGSEEVSAGATSSFSKVSSSHNKRANIDEVKGSPVESVSSSPFRTFYQDKFTSAGENTSGKNDGARNCIPVNENQERCWGGEGGCEMKEKDSCNSRTKTVKSSALGYVEGYVSHNVPPQFRNDHLLNGDFDSVKHQQSPSDLHVMEHGYVEDAGNQNNHERVFFPQKCNEGSLLQSKDSDRSSASDAFRDKMKFPNLFTGDGNLFLKKNMNCDSSKIGLDYQPPSYEMISEDKQNVCEFKSKFHENVKNHLNRRDPERQLPSDGKMEKQIVVKEHDDISAKLSANKNRKVAFQQTLMQDFEVEEKVFQSQRECGSEDGQKKRGNQSVRGPLRKQMFDEVPVADSCKADVLEALNNSGNVVNTYGACQNLLDCRSDLHRVKDLNDPTPRRMKSSSQHATYSLKEAKELIAYADRLKSSGFDFESNEAYFQAALKFLHGASLLETCGGEGGNNGDMTQIQVYNTTAKLCESCAHEYERRQEMAAAALAYKCMEVAYMRVVCCKHSIVSRDWNELQATLHTASQGNSPSSSASDVDNLTNQMTSDMATSSKGVVPHVTGNHVIVARNRPNFIRLLDFTQDVNFAMEASRNSQNTFAAANITPVETQKRDCISTIKKVIDFSFQDVEELLRLVRIALEAISRSGVGGTRD